MFKPKQQAKERELIPAGTHEGYCYGLVSLGTHDRKPFKGVPKAPAQYICLMFEFTEIRRVFKEENGEEPCVKSTIMPFFFGDNANFTKLVKPWIGEPEKFELKDMVGMPVSITVAHEAGSDDKIYDNIIGLAPMSPKLIPLMPTQHNKSMLFDIETHGIDSAEFKALYPWMQEKIGKSHEASSHEAVEPPVSETEEDDDSQQIPF